MTRPSILCGILLASASAALAGAPSFQSLMDPAWMPQAQRGMILEAADVQGGAELHIRTTGATLQATATRWQIGQRIGPQRPLVELQWAEPLPGSPVVRAQHSGCAVVDWGAALTLRANGDSLFMIQARRPLKLRVHGRILTGFAASHGPNHVIADELGGYGVYCSRSAAEQRWTAYLDPVAEYDLAGDDVLWVAAFPPKPYDWAAAKRNQVVWHWSNQSAYPSDAALAAWGGWGSIALLQSEVMLWKDWNLAFEPRLGAAEFARVRDTLHRHGLRMMVYTSPFYFFPGTGLESSAMNSFEGFVNWPGGTPTGENMPRFMAAISKLLAEHQPDGLYFDGQYSENPAALYALARETRALLGEDRVLEWHSTTALGNELCSLPTADAYVDILLRGEGRGALYSDERYLRYFVSGYQLHNSVGVLCNNGPPPLTAELVRRLLSVNARLHMMAGWLGSPEPMALMKDEYLARLNDELPAEVDRAMARRQAALPEQVAARAAEEQALRNEPPASEPILAFSFDEPLTGWTFSRPPEDTRAQSSVADGVLQVTGPASLHAFWSRPLNTPVSMLTVKLARGSDGGASWGPGVCVRWAEGGNLRIGLRNDGLIQSDVNGDQRLDKPDPGEWTWVRARWGPTSGIIECSPDGRTYRRLWSFDHVGTFAKPAKDVCIGKVPYNGQPIDYTDPGPVGTSRYDDLRLYAPTQPASAPANSTGR